MARRVVFDFSSSPHTQEMWSSERTVIVDGGGTLPTHRYLGKIYVSRFLTDLGAMFRYFGLFSNACSLCICPGDQLGTFPPDYKSCTHAWRSEDTARAAVVAAQGGPPLSDGALTCEDLRIKPVWVR